MYPLFEGGILRTLSARPQSGRKLTGCERVDGGLYLLDYWRWHRNVTQRLSVFLALRQTVPDEILKNGQLTLVVLLVHEQPGISDDRIGVLRFRVCHPYDHVGGQLRGCERRLSRGRAGGDIC